MEFPDLGEHCSEKSCKRLDFLPMRCDACEGIFCKDHITYASHKCTSSYKREHAREHAHGKECSCHPSSSSASERFFYTAGVCNQGMEITAEDVQVPVCPLCNTPIPIKRGEMPDIKVGEHIDRDCKSDPAQRKKIFTNKCSKGGCKQKEMIHVTCDQCHFNYCLKHRHPLDHDCKADGKSVSKSGHAALMRAQGASSSSAAGLSVQGTGAGRAPRAQTNSAQRISAPSLSVVPPAVQNVIPSSASYQAGLTEEQALQHALALSLSETARNTPPALSPQEQEDLALAQALAASEVEYQQQQQRQQGRDSKQSNCSLS